MRSDQSGAISLVGILSVIFGILLLITIIIASSLYSSENKYKNQSDSLVATAVNAAKQQQLASDTNQFAQEAKQPLVSYVGPQAFGTITLKYPKTWSAYVIDDSTSQNAVNGYFQPGFVPDVSNSANFFALRIEIINQTYDQVVQTYTSAAKTGTVSVVPYSLPLVPSVVGIEVKGNIEGNVTSGILVALPLRNTTVEVWTEGQSYQNDFSTIILPNLTFSP